MSGRYKVVSPNNPNEPVFVEYIENTGSNWIQTDISDPNNKMSIDILIGDMQYGPDQQGWIVGIYSGIGFYVSSNGNIANPGGNAPITYVDSNKQYNVKLFRNSNGNRCAQVNDMPAVVGSTHEVSANPLTVFHQSQYPAYRKAKIYFIKVYDNNVLSYDLRPCLSRESGHIDEPALYDTINKKYYYNNGVGTFNVGQKIIKSYRIMEPVDLSAPVFVEYIQSTGTQYIDPELPANSVGNLEEVDIDFNWTSFNSGNGQPTIMNFYGIQFYQTSSELRIWHNALNSKTLGDIEINHRYKSYIRRQVGGKIQAKLDDGSLITLGNTPASAPHSVYMFAWDTSISYPSLIKLYGCKFTRNGTVIRDLRPCLSREAGHINEPALYDMVNKKYYYNQGTGTFGTERIISYTYRKLILSRPDLREWLQMPPASIIRMEDVPVYTSLRNIRFKTKFRQYGNSSDYSTVIGNINHDQNVRMVRILTSNSGATDLYWYQYSINTQSAGSSSIASDTDCVVELGPSIATQNGSNVSMIQSVLNTACNDNKYYPFFIGDGNAKGRTLRFYYVEIYEWDKLIRDLRPCLSTEPGHNGEPALYDMVTNKYYYNSGTGTFSVGNKI